MRARLLIAATSLGLLALAPAAHAATFGADLNSLPANNDPTYSCARQVPGRPDSPQGAQSCMWSYFQSGSTTNTLIAPVTGTVQRVRVKVGATTGPMRVNVIRFLFQQTADPSRPMSAGPFLESYGPRFTPAANATTTVAANLPVQEDPTPPASDKSTVQVIDALALEVEAPNVPIPLFGSANTLSYPVVPGPSASGTPAPSPNALPTYTTTAGVGVLMNADIDAGTGALPALGLRSRTAKVKNGVASLPIICRAADCSGLVSLRKLTGQAATAAKKKRKKTVTYGSRRFKVKAGKKATIRITLTKAGRTLLKHHRKVKVSVRISYSKGGGKTTTVRVTLKR